MPYNSTNSETAYSANFRHGKVVLNNSIQTTVRCALSFTQSFLLELWKI